MGSLKYVRGFENYRWYPAWSLMKKDGLSVYEHRKLGILIYIEEERSWDWNKSVVECKLFNEGKPLTKNVRNKKDLEDSLEDIFKELVSYDSNKKILFRGLLK